MNEQKESIEALDDDALDTVAGGYLEVSKWRDYVSTSIIGSLNSLSASASGVDKNIVDLASNIIMGTMVPGAAVADPIRSLWYSYQSSYRFSIESDHVRQTLDVVLGNANNYISTHL